MKNYQYKLIFDHIETSVPNSGGAGTTDWTNAVMGVADGWEITGYGGSLAAIVTPAGFTGNAQRFVKSTTLAQGMQSSFTINCQAGKKVTIKLRYAANVDWNLLVNDTIVGVLTSNSMTPTDIEIDFYADRNSINRVGITNTPDAAASEFIIDELELQFISASENILTKNPAGWNDLGISFTRSKIYQSVMRSFSLSLRFVKKPGGGGSDIETAYYLDGISAKVSIQIRQRNPQTNDYDLFYTGILDFNPQRFSNPRDWVETAIIDSDKLQKFKARDEINFDLNSVISADNISVNPFLRSPKDVIFQPIDIYLNVVETGTFSRDIVFSDQAGNIPPIGPVVVYLDDTEIYFWASDVTINEIGDRLQTEEGPSTSDRTAEIYVNETDFEAIITFDDVTWDDNNSKVTFYTYDPTLSYAKLFVYIKLEIYDSDDALVQQLFVDQHTFEESYDPSGTIVIPINFDLSLMLVGSFTVPSGGKLVFKTEVNPVQGTWSRVVCVYNQGLLNNLSFTEVTPSIGQTAVECYYPFEAFSRLIQLITSEQDTGKLLDSNYLGRTDSEFQGYGSNGAGSLDAITTGWNARAFPGRAFNVNIQDLFTSFADAHGLGLGYDRVNDLFYIEPIAQFYDSGYFMFDLGEVASLVRKPNREAFASKVTSGYTEKGDYEDFQGVNEFNLLSEHSMPLPVKQTKAARSKYNRDSIGMELARRFSYSKNASKDTKYDEKIYIVDTLNGYTVQGAANLSGFDGINQYYNLKYTPRENLIRNAGFYKSSLWNHELLLKFIKAQKDRDITYTNQNGDTVNEFDDLSGQDLQETALYIPELYEFEAPFTPDMLAVLNTNPHGYIRFSFDGANYEGFLLTVESGYYNRKATYKLLAKQLTFGDNFVFEDEDNFVFENEDNTVFD